jgi:Ca2+-transporting ATPase
MQAQQGYTRLTGRNRAPRPLRTSERGDNLGDESLSPRRIHYMSVTLGPAAPALEGRHLRRLPGRIRAEVTGLRGNPLFAARIERAFAAQPGVERAEANPATGRVLVLYDGGVISERTVLALVWELESLQRRRTRRRRPGFGAPPPRTPGLLLAQAFQPVAAIGAAVGSVLKVAVRGPSPRSMSERLNALSVCLAVTGGYPQISIPLQRSLGRRVPVDQFLNYTAIGIKGIRGAALGLTADGAEGLFEFLEQSGLRRAERARRRALRPHGRVRLHLRSGGEMEIPVSELQPGSAIRLEGPVDVPADAVIVEGTALLDEWIFTGRALRTRKIAGEAIYLGTRIQHGAVLARVQATGQWTRLGRMLSAAGRGPRRDGLPAAAVRAILRAGKAGLVAGCATLLLTRSWRRALAVLAVMNPNTVQAPAIACAGAGSEVAAGAGVQVLRRGALDVLRGVDVVILDKAATLAADVPEVADVIAAPGEDAGRVLSLAASLVRHEAFPGTAPIFERALEAHAALLDATDVRTIDAAGIRGRVGEVDDVLVGAATVLAAHGVPVDVLRDALAQVRAAGDAALCVAASGRAIGLLVLRERMQDGAADAVQRLRSAGVGTVAAWSTDGSPATERLARAAGIERVWAGAAAHERRAIVCRFQREGHIVAVVGGAADDLRAGTRADLVIAVGGGRDGQRHGAVSRTAHLVLPPGRLELVAALIGLSRRMAAIQGENERLASAVCAAGAAAAFLGLLPFGVADDVNHYAMLLLLANARRVTLEHLDGAAPGPALPVGQPPWHALPPAEVAHTLDTDLSLGLTEDEAARRLQRAGLNVLAEAPPPSFPELAVRQMKTGMTALLGGAAAASALVGERFNAGLIGAVVLLNGSLGAAQEYRAGRATAALRRYVAPTARCRRNGEERLVPATHLVPGDVVELQAGDVVPADARLIEGYEFEVEEAALTGEAFPVEKRADAVDPGTGLADRTSMVYMGSAVAHGRARAAVVATGMDTAIGRIAGLLGNGAAGRPETVLQTKIARMSRGLVGLAGLGGLLFVAAGLARRLSLRELVMGGVSLATAAVPEGLPSIVTIALTAAVQRMGRRSLIVRRLNAVETLGRVTVVCCDKTGTLTQNRMTVQAVAGGALRWDGETAGEARLRAPDVAQALTIGAVCNDAALVAGAARTTVGGHTESALLLAAADAGLDPTALRAAYARIAELPFSTERGFMAVVCRHAVHGLVLMVKGAPETVVDFCDRRLLDGDVAPFDDAARAQALELSDRIAYEAMRVLAMAYAPLEAVPGAGALAAPRGCILAGLVGMTDPIRPEVRPAVARCEAGGVRVVMATGDHRSTAVAIARQLGLGFARAGVLEGRDLDRMSDDELAAALPRMRVFARVTPEHKLRIITTMQARGDVVAMTGDGVNDAPAVKRADVGIAMGHTGTEVTRQASAIVLGDDSFVSIVRAIEEGRGVRRNLRRAVGFLLGGNMGETLFMLGATLIGGEVPLAPVHLLLVNLFTDALPVMALAAAPAPPDAFGARPEGELFDAAFQRGVVRRGIVTGLAATAIYTMARRWSPRDYRSMTFAGLIAAQLVQAQNWRRGEAADAFFTGALSASWAGLGLLTTVPALRRPLGLQVLGPLGWAAVLGVSLAADRVLGGGLPGPRLGAPAANERTIAGLLGTST